MKVRAIYFSLIKYLGFAAILVSFSGLYAQSAATAKLEVVVALKVKNGDLKNSQVTITRKGEPFKILDPAQGETTVELPLGYEYLFAFTKLGYVTENIYIDTHVPENREKRTFKKQNFKVELEKERDKESGGDIKLAYNMSLQDFDYYKGKGPRLIKEKVAAPVSTAKTKVNVADTVREPSNPEEHTTKAGGKIKDKKVTQMDTKKITNITIVIDDKEYIYKKEEYDWGGVFFYKNGMGITSDTYRMETEE